MTATDAKAELHRLRNRHVAKLLTHLGESPPYLVTAIKRAMSMFAEDVESNVIVACNQSDHSDHSDNSEEHDGNRRG